MRASAIVTFVFCWTAFVLGVLFAFSPEIKRLVFRKDRLELERYKQQVNKALVEYDVAVDFNELEKSADKFQDLNERERYK